MKRFHFAKETHSSKGPLKPLVVKKWKFQFRDSGRGTREAPVSLWPLQPHVDKFGLDGELEARPATLEKVMCVPLCPHALGRDSEDSCEPPLCGRYPAPLKD